jgi:hypothetical protein
MRCAIATYVIATLGESEETRSCPKTLAIGETTTIQTSKIRWGSSARLGCHTDVIYIAWYVLN